MAYEVRELDLPFPNQLFEQGTRSRNLMVLLPGAGYSCDMPLLYSCTQLGLEKGWDVLQIRYAFKLSSTDPDEELRSKVTSSLRKALSGRPWDTIFLVGKSVGTRAMTLLFDSDVLNGYAVKPVWLTPLMKREEVLAGMKKSPGLVVIGTADHHFQPKKLEELSGSQVLKIEGADHSLEANNDVQRSLTELQKIIKYVAEFLS
jgi:predicted alpha/beta-hydrolase family hydrolase